MPELSCPTCKQSLEYHATIEMLNPPVGKIDTGYCIRCRRLVERIRDTGTYYETTLWPPLCRSCRQPVTFAAMARGEGEESAALFQCSVHSSEKWLWAPATERWTRSD